MQVVLGVIAKTRPLNYVIFNVKYLYLRVNEGSSLSDHSLYARLLLPGLPLVAGLL